VSQGADSATFSYQDSSPTETSLDIGSVTFEMTQDTTEDVAIVVGSSDVLTTEDGQTVPFDTVEENDATLSLTGQVTQNTATVSTGSVSLEQVGDTAQTSVTIQADEAVTAADVTVSVNNDNVTITEITPIDATEVSGNKFSYSSPSGAKNIELGNVTFELTGSAEGEIPIGLETANFFNSSFEPYPNMETQPGSVFVGAKLFTQPILPEYGAAPQNIPVSEGGFNDTLYEDLDGDGNATDVNQTVTAFGNLIRGDFPDLSDEQGNALDWNNDGPEVTVQDMVALFGKQIRASQ
jgi:hypothetical protein